MVVDRINNPLRVLLGTVFVCSSLMKVAGIRSFADVVDQFCGLLGIDWLYGYGLPLAIGICAGELLMGVLLLARWHEHHVSWALVLLMVLFTTLTLLNYISTGESVESCGCFGEFIHFSPAASFYKNVVLLLAAALLHILSRYSSKPEKIVYNNENSN